ncbi:exodeoxyribonuclease VII large subunit [Prevotella dentalis]|uniref:exodeoxyribonuclease VII large subunit n=1 Tax=Prevotella dentalis TaxID=52227 RepID=UPI002659DF0A|nr:exodeoxyribonuclease VII large subunit [Prevotella dentalis]MCF2637377.1 exodeoxyribonuclease VII large subunit [Prevotella dentalis]
MASERTFTLLELNHMVRETIERQMDGKYWVEAELSDLHDRNHCYMDLVENDPFGPTPLAKARAVCWANRWTALRSKFERQTQQQLRPGIKVRMMVTPTFHEAYGFAYQVSDIDPDYTLGDIVRKRMEIIRQLKEAGIFDLQRELALPRFAQRIAVISSAQAAGYGDFCHQIDDNSYGLSFSHELFAAIMQGEQVEQSVIAALDRINARIDEFDVVVIIRGGGATTDMSGFDTLALAENVANFPLPIITGIGHDRDECILDMVSYMRVKTPTAAAAFLIDHLSEVYTALVSARERISRIAERHLAYEKMRLKQLADRIPTLFALTRERQTKRIDALAHRLDSAATQRLERERHRLQLVAQRAQAQDPIHILRRGYSITLHNGHALRSGDELADGDIIETRLEQGTLKSEIRK